MKIEEHPKAVYYLDKANKHQWMKQRVSYMQRHELNIFLGYLIDSMENGTYIWDMWDVEQTEDKMDMV